MSGPGTPATNIHLIRHAQSIANVEPIIGGMKGDTGLSPLGHRQAERLAQRLKREAGAFAADVLLASTLPRARQTAEYISDAIGLSVVYDDDLQELRPGEADGMAWDDFLEKYYGGGFPWDYSDPYLEMAPGGESWAEFLVRVGRTAKRLRTEYEGKTLLVVTHGGFIDGSFYKFMGLGSGYGIGFQTLNTSLTHWRYAAPDDASSIPARPQRWILVSYNDAAHAADLRPASEPAVPLPTEEPKGED